MRTAFHVEVVGQKIQMLQKPPEDIFIRSCTGYFYENIPKDLKIGALFGRTKLRRGYLPNELCTGCRRSRPIQQRTDMLQRLVRLGASDKNDHIQALGE